ncbi:MAG TPA: hypothetical protein VN457_06995, partial [Chlamydiales bacterium]|nr:hypothetical protein [Chlamydiales bacterium]
EELIALGKLAHFIDYQDLFSCCLQQLGKRYKTITIASVDELKHQVDELKPFEGLHPEVSALKILLVSRYLNVELSFQRSMNGRFLNGHSSLLAVEQLTWIQGSGIVAEILRQSVNGCIISFESPEDNYFALECMCTEDRQLINEIKIQCLGQDVEDFLQTVFDTAISEKFPNLHTLCIPLVIFTKIHKLQENMSLWLAKAVVKALQFIKKNPFLKSHIQTFCLAKCYVNGNKKDPLAITEELLQELATGPAVLLGSVTHFIVDTKSTFFLQQCQKAPEAVGKELKACKGLQLYEFHESAYNTDGTQLTIRCSFPSEQAPLDFAKSRSSAPPISAASSSSSSAASVTAVKATMLAPYFLHAKNFSQLQKEVESGVTFGLEIWRKRLASHDRRKEGALPAAFLEIAPLLSELLLSELS